MALLVPLRILQLHVLPQTQFYNGHFMADHPAHFRIVESPLQFAASPAYASAGVSVYPTSVFSTAYHSIPPYQFDYQSSLTYDTAEINDIVGHFVTEADPASKEGRFTKPRVFFDDDHNEDSRLKRLQEDLREERLRQNFRQHTPGEVPLRKIRRYEKSVEGDLDFSEDKELKLTKRGKRGTVTNAASRTQIVRDLTMV
ncbi:hypothetical protein BIW11_06435 [Tropilaelaps mercedesae]|uniref:Uncharacterized protein n=1 Tax=Tropilaelaps mercedesae TaxID=418985 RepID=A0A1V9XY42_9ACAR|nr:hypothetical protein BIW11_06435 [Tropilaelaps mercedesae]